MQTMLQKKNKKKGVLERCDGVLEPLKEEADVDDEEEKIALFMPRPPTVLGALLVAGS